MDKTIKTREWHDDAREWIKSAQDTNEYCERNLVIAALLSLEEGRVEEAKARLLQIFSGSELVRVPEHVVGVLESKN